MRAMCACYVCVLCVHAMYAPVRAMYAHHAPVRAMYALARMVRLYARPHPPAKLKFDINYSMNTGIILEPLSRRLSDLDLVLLGLTSREIRRILRRTTHLAYIRISPLELLPYIDTILDIPNMMSAMVQLRDMYGLVNMGPRRRSNSNMEVIALRNMIIVAAVHREHMDTIYELCWLGSSNPVHISSLRMEADYYRAHGIHVAALIIERTLRRHILWYAHD